MQMTRTDRKSRRGIRWFLIAILASIIIPVIVGCFFSGPSADDFTNATGWKSSTENRFQYMISNTVKIYKNWQGTYFGCFLLGFPVFFVYGYTGLRIWLLVVTVFFFCSCFYSVYSIIKIICPQKEHRGNSCLILLTTGLFYLINTNTLDEIFYWYTGSCVYTVPICLALLCVTLNLKYLMEKKTKYLILGIIFSIGSAGGSLDVAALLCSLLVLVNFFVFLKKKRFGLGTLICIFAIIGAIVNVIAPGNYVRHAAIDTKIRVLSSVYSSVERTFAIISNDIQSGLLLVLIIVSFLFGYKKLNVKWNEFRYPVIVMFFGIVAISATIFPVILGYSGVEDMPSRCSFVDHLAVVIYMFIISAFWGGWCAKKELFDFSRTVIMIMVIVCAIPMSQYLKFNNLSTLTSYKMIYHMGNGDFSRIEQSERNIIKQIMESKDEDVCVYIDQPKDKEWANIKRIGLSGDKNHWINKGVAKVFEKKTITVQYK